MDLGEPWKRSSSLKGVRTNMLRTIVSVLKAKASPGGTVVLPVSSHCHHCQGAAESGELSLSTSSFTTEPGFQVKSRICGYWVSLWHLPLFLNSPHCSWESWVLDLSPWYTLTEAWSRESEQGPSSWLMLSTVRHKELKPQLCRMKATSFWSRSLWIYWIRIYQSLLFYKRSQSQKSSQIFGNNRLWRQGG